MDSISVAVRVRPLNERETSQGHTVAWKIAENQISQMMGVGVSYCFDHIFNPDSKTIEVNVHILKLLQMTENPDYPNPEHALQMTLRFTTKLQETLFAQVWKA
jgi:hypothetical protein